jgi:hypothetical protein
LKSNGPNKVIVAIKHLNVVHFYLRKIHFHVKTPFHERAYVHHKKRDVHNEKLFFFLSVKHNEHMFIMKNIHVLNEKTLVQKVPLTL